MVTYIVRRLLGMIPMLICITIVTFLLMHAAPGNAIIAAINPHIKDPTALKARLLHNAGLDQSLPVQYVTWLWHFVQGQWGWSYTENEPVIQLIAPAMRNTLTLAIVTEILVLAVGVPLGIRQARKPYRTFDNTASFVGLIFYSIPYYILAIVLIYFLAIKLNIFPAQNAVGDGPNAGSFIDRFYHVLLPAISLSIASIAGYSRYTRGSLLDVRGRDYTRTARAKGLSEKAVFRKHVFRNGLIPIVTQFGYDLGGLVGGAIIVENLFAFQGMGQLTVIAATQRDYNVILATTVIFAVAILVGNLIADVLYGVVDPRIRYN